MTEIGLTLSGQWRVAQRTVENALASPQRGSLFQGLGSGSSGDGLRYCWTCHMKTLHDSAGFSLPICRRCVGKPTKRRMDRRSASRAPSAEGGPRIPTEASA